LGIHTALFFFYPDGRLVFIGLLDEEGSGTGVEPYLILNHDFFDEHVIHSPTFLFNVGFFFLWNIQLTAKKQNRFLDYKYYITIRLFVNKAESFLAAYTFTAFLFFFALCILPFSWKKTAAIAHDFLVFVPDFQGGEPA